MDLVVVSVSVHRYLAVFQQGLERGDRRVLTLHHIQSPVTFKSLLTVLLSLRYMPWPIGNLVEGDGE